MVLWPIRARLLFELFYKKKYQWPKTSTPGKPYRFAIKKERTVGRSKFSNDKTTFDPHDA